MNLPHLKTMQTSFHYVYWMLSLHGPDRLYSCEAIKQLHIWRRYWS